MHQLTPSDYSIERKRYQRESVDQMCEMCAISIPLFLPMFK